MHEMGIVAGVIDAVVASAKEAGAEKVLAVDLRIGEMTEAIPDALQFAFEALGEGTLCEGAELRLDIVKPRSVCLACEAEFAHDRFHRVCPACGSYETQLLDGRELEIASIEVELPDDEDEASGAARNGGPEGASGAARSAAGDASAADGGSAWNEEE